MKYSCPKCGKPLPTWQVVLDKRVKCQNCHAICGKKITMTSYFFAIPIALVSLWVGFQCKSLWAIPILMISWFVADAFSTVKEIKET
jgi:DNA-directed RNA polymerase subunit RPC12/RpoP